MGLLEGRGAVVSGASRGIGLAVARALAAAGARVVMVARGREALVREAAAIGSAARAVAADVTNADDVSRVAAEAGQWLGGTPDLVVAAAGAFSLAPVAATEPDEFAAAIAANLTAPFLLARAFVPGMLARGSGRLVLVGSVADRTIFPENGAYAASKFGARALWEVLRAELRGTGVHASLVAPGPTDTALWDPVDPDAREGFLPRRLMMRPDAVAEAVLFALTRPAGIGVDELRLSPA